MPPLSRNGISRRKQMGTSPGRCPPPEPGQVRCGDTSGTEAKRCDAVPAAGQMRCGVRRRDRCGAERPAQVPAAVPGAERAAPGAAVRVPQPGRRAGLIRPRCPLLPAALSAPAERAGAAIPGRGSPPRASGLRDCATAQPRLSAGTPQTWVAVQSFWREDIPHDSFPRWATYPRSLTYSTISPKG